MTLERLQSYLKVLKYLSSSHNIILQGANAMNEKIENYKYVLSHDQNY
jgi:hypothetical protein